MEYKRISRPKGQIEYNDPMYKRLQELEDKIEQGTLIEMPRIVRRGDMSCGYEEYLVQWEKDNGKIKSRIYNNERSAKAKLRELKGDR